MENVFLFVPNLIGIEFPQAITSQQRVTSGYSGVCSMTNQLIERSPSGLSTPTKRLIRNGWLGKLIGYARIILAAIAFCLMRSLPGAAFSLYLLSGFLDAFDGFAARALNQGSRFGAMLDMLTDRCATACLIVNLALLYPSATPLFQLSLSLDVASHWLHLHSSVLKGNESHKNLGGKASRLLGLYYKSRLVLFLMCAGNELFYSCLFLNYHYSGPIVPGLQLGLLPLLVVIFSPVAILKAVIALMQLLAASANIAEVDRVERERVVKRK